MSFIDNKNLYNLVEEFNKLASELKVPGSILNEAISWAKSMYCKRILDKQDVQLKYMRFRNVELQEINDIIESTKFRALSFILTNKNNVNELFNFLKDNNIDIENFSKDTDNRSDLDGIFDASRSPRALQIVIRKKFPEPNTYDCFLYINHEDMQVDIKKTNISKNEVLSIIKDNIDNIKDVLQDFESFAKYFQTFDNMDKENRQNIGFVRAICTKHINEKQLSNPYQLVIDPAKSKYFFHHEIEENKKYLIYIWCNFIFDPKQATELHGESTWKGLWNGQLYIFEKDDDYVLHNPQELNRRLKDLEGTVRHELQHMMQWWISDIKKLEDSGVPSGIPGKKLRTPGHSPHGFPTTKDNKEIDDNRQSHELRDIEFYTRIADNIQDYKNIINKIPVSIRSIFFKVWTSQVDIKILRRAMREEYAKRNVKYHEDALIVASIRDSNQFFDALKNVQPLKYRKAVAEVYKAVNAAGLI